MSQFDKALDKMLLRYAEEELLREKIASGVIGLEDFFIISKARQKVRMSPENLTEIQRAMLSRLSPELSGKKERHIILKPRQIGSSTIWALVMLRMALNVQQTLAYIIAHEKATSQHLLGMIRSVYDDIEKVKPTLDRDNENEFSFIENGSKLRIGTALNLKVGRGITVHGVLGTEFAFWQNPEFIFAGLMNAVPHDDGIVVLESTANGVGNTFYDMFMHAWLNPEEAYVPHFYKWSDMHTYRAPVDVPFDLSDDADHKYGDEIAIAEEHNLDLEQVAFRRSKIDEYPLSVSGKKIFCQEYPLTVKEAFIGTGQSIFNEDGLHWLKTSCNCEQLPHHRINPSYVRGLRQNEVSLFLTPKAGESYVVTCDPSEGKGEEGDYDYTSISVWSERTWEQCLHVRSRRIESSEIAKVLVDVAHWYNNAILVVERNNHGHAVIQATLALGYSNFYAYKDFSQNTTKHGARKKESFGFHANIKSKKLAEDALAENIADKAIRIYSLVMVDELENFRRLEGGKTGAPKGKHDDCVSDAKMFAYYEKYKDSTKTRKGGIKIYKMSQRGFV